MAASKKKKPDWDRIEREYRLGQKSMRTLADEFGVAASSICRRAKTYLWVQDKTDEVRQRTKALLLAQQERNTPTKEDIEIAVKSNVEVIREHRNDIKKHRNTVQVLASQLAEAADSRAEIEAEIEAATKDDQSPKNRDRMLRAVGLPAHATVARDLSTALKNLVALERQAFSLDEQTNPVEQTLSDILGLIDGSSKGLPVETNS